MTDAYRPPETWFKDWWLSTELLPTVIEHNAKVPSDDFFNRGELQPLREAYAASLFAWIVGERRKVRIKLDAAQFPDFQLERDGKAVPFELVEAYRPGERRGAEYKGAAKRRAAGLPERIEEFDPIEDEKNAPPAITKAIAKKASKHYGSVTCLLVYVNFWLFDKPKISLNELAELASPWATQFLEIWLLWGANAVCCSPDAEMINAQSLPTGMVP